MSTARISAPGIRGLAVTLVGFLLARVAEDEEVARRASVEGANWLAASHGAVWSEDPEADPAVPVAYAEGRPLGEQAEHIARWDPVRVLAECQARRAIIGLHEHVGSFLSEWYDGDPVPFESGQFGCRICAVDDRQIEPEGWCATLLALALPFKDHPDFLAEWSQD